MKQVGKIGLVVILIALFAYLLMIDYPKTIHNLTPKSDAVAAATSESSLSDTSMVSDLEQEPDMESVKAQIPNTKTVLFVGSIRQTVYDTIYPTLNDAGYTGTLLFLNGRLTGDYQQMSTDQFQELINAGWDYAIGGIDSDLSEEDWRNNLLDEIDQIEERSGVRPSVYYFQTGEYRLELESVLQEEEFAAFYYSAEDGTNVAQGTSDLRKSCYIPFSAETELHGLLDEAWRYDSAAFGAAIDSDEEELTAEEWNELLSLLSTDGRFDVMSQSDWLDSDLEDYSDRAELVSMVLASEENQTE